MKLNNHYQQEKMKLKNEKRNTEVNKMISKIKNTNQKKSSFTMKK